MKRKMKTKQKTIKGREWEKVWYEWKGCTARQRERERKGRERNGREEEEDVQRKRREEGREERKGE